MSKVKTFIIIFIILFILVLIAVFIFHRAPNTTTTSTTTTTTTTVTSPDPLAAEKSAAANTVLQFGTRMQDVSVLAPTAYVVASMQKYYTPYVDPELLAIWENNPVNAPGRTVSSPWPVRIDIDSISKDSDGNYEVVGTVVEVTSTEVRNGGAADTYPVYITLQNENGAWMILTFEKGTPS